MAGDNYEERERFDGQKVKILLPEYAPAKDEDQYQWRSNINLINFGEGDAPTKRYLSTAERYFYTKEWFGSEKRKNPA
jgi:hypothetical protein